MVTDPANQSTIYSYYVDNNPAQVAYSNSVVTTPAVSFTYDTNYNRVVTMTDGTGTTTYRYYSVTNGQLGAGMVSSVSNSFIGSSSAITFNYDVLGRITNRALNGVSQQFAFDALHRVTVVTNVLGNFTNTYVGGTALVSTNFAPFGKKTIFSYLSITNDERLSEIWNQKTNGVTLSKFDYGYDPVGQITNWTRQADTNSATVYTFGYDAGNQLLNAVLKSTGVGATVLKQYAYGYDLAGNRTSEQIDTGMSQCMFNNLNQLTNRSVASGSMQFAGTLSKQATVAVAGSPATVNHATTNFVGYTSVTNGTNVVPITATDYSGNSATNKYQVVVTNNGVAETITYDVNGNETSVVTATSTNTYQWDAANRLVSITGPTNQSLFTYDGLGRRVQIIEKTNGVAYATNKFIWDALALLEQRDLTGATVVRRFFGEGEQISGTNYYFTRDHLGSIREMVDRTGAIRARCDYDPYGRPAKLQGDLNADFAFTGHYYHQPSGLCLTMYRAYDPNTGRWLTVDPIEELGGLNLYAYVRNSPIRNADPYGLYTFEAKFWADLSVSGSWWQQALAWPLGIIAAAQPDAMGVSVSGTAGFIGGGTVGVQDVGFWNDASTPPTEAQYSFVGYTKGPHDCPPGFVTPQIGISVSLLVAWSSEYHPGPNSWTGPFSEMNIYEGLLTEGGFKSDSWTGLSIGAGIGPVPAGASYLDKVDYQFLKK